MEEPSSEDSDNMIDEIYSALQQNSLNRTERVTQKLKSSATMDSFGFEQSFDIGQLIEEAEVVIEDGLNINDVINQEFVVVETRELEHGQSKDSKRDLQDSDNSVTEKNKKINQQKNGKVFDNSSDDPITIQSNLEEQANFFDDEIPIDPDYSPSEVNKGQDDVYMTENIGLQKEQGISNESNVAITPDLCALEVIEDDNLTSRRKRRKRPNKSEWDVIKNQQLRMTGHMYKGYKKVKVDGKIVVKRSDGHRAERKMGTVCNSTICRSNKNRNCTEISEGNRSLIFKEFWALSWSEKKVYITAHIKKTKKKQVTVKGEKQSRRSHTFKYFLSANNELKPVCKVMFLNTLGVKEWMVQNWVKKSNEEQIADEENESLSVDDAVQVEVEDSKREKNISKKQQIIAEWLDSLPKVPAHYCRASSSKLYLEPLWLTKKELYTTYKQYCNEHGKLVGSLTLFMKVFESKNISIYIPKKDQCDTCYSFKSGNISKEDHDKHLRDKESARKEKEIDKKLALDGKVYCLTCDVESVKLAPATKASAMYYKTKLCCHNYTVYNLETRHCCCYWFTEVDGDLSANTFASCLVDYLKENCLNPKRPIIIYSDGCTNQNRNQYVSNALLHFAVQSEIDVKQKYLIKGHTQMEGDSVHARIENTIKGRDVYVPYEYVRYTRQARTNPFPYEAKYLKYDFFKNYDTISYYDSIRPGKKKGDPVVTDVHYLHYLPKGEILYKLSFEDLPEILPRRPKHVDKNAVPTQLFKEKIKISSKKWSHLQELKSVIPSDYHEYYDNLPHHN